MSQLPHHNGRFHRHHSENSTNLQLRGTLISHSTSLPTPAANDQSENNFLRQSDSFQRRTVEGTRLLTDNLTNVISSVNATGMSLASFLSPRSNADPRSVNTNPNSPSSESYVINLEDETPANNSILQNLNVPNNGNGHSHQAANVLNDAPPPPADAEGPNAETLHQVLEAQQCVKVLQQYVPFILILLSKGLYDHREGILNLIILFATFMHANSVVKKEATKQARRSLSRLFMALLYITVCLAFISFIFDDEKLHLHLIFIPTYKQPLHMYDLLWIVGITDFILKLITVAFKIVLTLLPAKIIQFQKRGKVYLFMEATSQLYRSMATIQPWLYYLLESYQGAEKIVGVFLSAAYMVSKGADLMGRCKLFKSAAFRLLQNMTLGSSPSKDQIVTAGNHCPICHDEYDSPVLLQCRHIFCESCVSTWFDREPTCPLCRAKIVDDPSWRDGSTTFFMQLF